MNSYAWKFLAGGALVLGLSGIALADADPKILQVCTDCHGEKGVSTEKDVPTIAGMSPIYLADNLTFYKNRERPCIETKYRHGDTSRPETTMCDVTSKLSESEIESVSEYFSQQQFVRARQPFDAAKAEIGAKIHDQNCEKCHEDAGSSAADDAGLLAGQWMEYLRHSFKEYSSGKRPMIEKMQIKYEKLSAEDIDALIHFYASKQ